MSYKICVVLLLAVCLAACGSSHNSPSLTTTTTTTPTTATTPNNSSPTTTLGAQMANNTSAANSFPNQVNGNLGAHNVSKVNVHSLLYPGANTKVLAQLLLWFGQSNHMNVGYNSDDPALVKSQVEDMISRGIDGVIVDWYGPNNPIDQATQLVMHEAENHPGFSFAIMVDAGAIGASSCNDCTSQQVLVDLLQYVEKNYFPSSAYLNIGGQPIVTNFNIDNQYSVDWQRANGQLTTPPRFWFQDEAGFNHAMSDGSYSWVMPWAGDYGMGYLTSFYHTGMAFADKETMGAAYKGFNDKLASWGSGRLMDQQCGSTWLQTFSQVNSLYNGGRQLPYLQLVTWNDYEEGTEIESGIDGCFSLQASLSGSELQWTTSGDENTVDHYTVYTSQDGQNLTKLTDLGIGIHALEMCSLSLPAGSYQLYVQAVGRPSIANRMPAPVRYTVACGN